ncbi:MAG: hypothetical protein HRU70_13800 [Phycisphaeraceae bacterium]|nr:MAG: hypothetical protein HRU70_13800 [Phycisphaeraceae bacterium]
MLNRPVLFPDLYPWYVLAAALDVMLTYVVLMLGGWEVNALADWVIRSHGLPGMLWFKFLTVVVVVGVCEYVGRRRHTTGRRLAVAAVAISFVPVAAALGQFAVAGAARAA